MQPKPSRALAKTRAGVGTPTAFPYDVYKGTRVWMTVERAIQDLVENHDIAETTRREYIVGYICKQLEKL